MNTATNTTRAFAHTTCCAEYPGCTGAPTTLWEGDEYCAHCAQLSRENHIEELEGELAFELQRVKDAQHDTEEALDNADELREKIAEAKGEAYIPAFRADPEMAVYILTKVMAELERNLAGAPAAAAEAAAKYTVSPRMMEDIIKAVYYDQFVKGVKRALANLAE